MALGRIKNFHMFTVQMLKIIVQLRLGMCMLHQSLFTDH